MAGSRGSNVWLGLVFLSLSCLALFCAGCFLSHLSPLMFPCTSTLVSLPLPAIPGDRPALPQHCNKIPGSPLIGLGTRPFVTFPDAAGGEGWKGTFSTPGRGNMRHERGDFLSKPWPEHGARHFLKGRSRGRLPKKGKWTLERHTQMSVPGTFRKKVTFPKSSLPLMLEKSGNHPCPDQQIVRLGLRRSQREACEAGSSIYLNK